MATTINKTDGTVLATVADGAVDTTTDITLIGRLYRNYGELVNENFAQMLENFADTSSPANPLEGQIWYDKGDSQLKIYRSTGFASLGISSRSANAPGSPVTGDMWYDTTNSQLKLYTGSAWIVVAPQYSTAQGKTGAVVETIQDTLSTNHDITIVYQGGYAIAAFSLDADFIPNNAITGFPSIKKGLTISNVADVNFNGNATTASAWETARLITLAGDLSGTASIDGSSDVTLTATVTANNVALGTDTTGNYAQDFAIAGAGITLTGSAGEGTSYTLTSSATASTVGDTIVLRDTNGNFSANIITATASQAQYADLAEKYTTDQEYPVGTVMCVGGEAETTAAGNDSIAIGVISENPAYLMNNESEGQAIGLKGRVPVRVTGAVRKGQAVYAWENGVSSTIATTSMVGVALESNDDTSEKLVECVLKV